MQHDGMANSYDKIENDTQRREITSCQNHVKLIFLSFGYHIKCQVHFLQHSNVLTHSFQSK